LPGALFGPEDLERTVPLTFRLALSSLLAWAGCATAPEAATPVAVAPVASPSIAASGASANPPAAASTEHPDASAAERSDSGCGEESETLEITLTTQHSRSKKGGGFVARVVNPALKLDEKFLDTGALDSGYSCCVHTEVEAISYTCELADGAVTARIYREKDELVIEASQGRPERRVPISCGAWLRFRGPAKDCEGSPVH
jgi:hypothetical protein